MRDGEEVRGFKHVPSFSRSLEKALHQALAFANERHQEYATLEHLLLALIDDQDAAAVMRACNVDLDKFSSATSSTTSRPNSRTWSPMATTIPSRRPGSSGSSSAR
jgi:ATP-dependent Clp protease ATP-binding subunit ClpA